MSIFNKPFTRFFRFVLILAIACLSLPADTSLGQGVNDNYQVYLPLMMANGTLSLSQEPALPPLDPPTDEPNNLGPDQVSPDINAPVIRADNFTDHLWDFASAAAVDQCNGNAMGKWSPVLDWPLIALHAVLTPNGNVMTFGTDETGMQGGQFIYDVWEPTSEINSTLANTTKTDLFCSVQAIIPSTGDILIAGGDSHDFLFNLDIDFLNELDAGGPVSTELRAAFDAGAQIVLSASATVQVEQAGSGTEEGQWTIVQSNGEARAVAMLNSTEADGYIEEQMQETGLDRDTIIVQMAYLGILGREADPGGLQTYTNYLANPNNTVEGLVSILWYSTEAVNLRNSMTTEEVAEQLYEGLLGRPSDPAGLAGTISALEAIDRTYIIIEEGQALKVYDAITTNNGNKDTNLYDDDAQTLTKLQTSMQYARWYATLTTLPNGEMLIQGGVDEEHDPVETNETYSATTGWRTLTGTTSNVAYSNDNGESRWWYPRSFLAPDGDVFVVSGSLMYYVDPEGNGDIRNEQSFGTDGYGYTSSAVMYDKGKILQIGGSHNEMLSDTAATTAQIIDINSGSPNISTAQPMNHARHWANTTVLPDGKVLVTGGSGGEVNTLENVAYAAEIWDPTDNIWQEDACAEIPRLYHSIAILLPDGRVLTAGGGAPGPLTNLNAEIYSPPYLFDANGNDAERPILGDISSTLGWNEVVNIDVTSSKPIDKVTFIRTGSVTHSFNNEQRFMELDFAQNGDSLSITMPENNRIAPPGYYMIFAVDEDGVPSVGEIVSLTSQTTLRNEVIVGMAYRGILGREVDPGGLQTYTNYLADPSKTIDGFVSILWNSGEAATMRQSMTTEQVAEQLYEELLGRSSDPGGLAATVNAINNGTGAARAADMLQSAEAESYIEELMNGS